MPTTFTHDIFGKEVFHKLPDELKGVIRKGKQVYRIGLHGPDIFFYYRPLMKNKINQIGHDMHWENASVFFRKAAEEYQKSPEPCLAAYLLGFACHFVLDSTCHGYIWNYEKEKGVSHAEIETELDRYFLEREGKELFHYLPTDPLVPSKENAQVIARVFPAAGEKAVQSAVRSQKIYDGLLTCKGKWKEKIVLGGMKIFGCYGKMEGQVMRKNSNPVCRESTKTLIGLYQQAVEDAVPVLENLYQALAGEGRLSPRFERNFE